MSAQAKLEAVPIPETVAVAFKDPLRRHVKLWRRVRLWLETPGHCCYRCGQPTVLVTPCQFELDPAGRPLRESGRGFGSLPPNAATIEHRGSRWDGPREYRGEEVLACHGCNSAGAAEDLQRWRDLRPGHPDVRRPSFPSLERFMAASPEQRLAMVTGELRQAWVEAKSTGRSDWAATIYEALGGNEVMIDD